MFEHQEFLPKDFIPPCARTPMDTEPDFMVTSPTTDPVSGDDLKSLVLCLGECGAIVEAPDGTGQDYSEACVRALAKICVFSESLT
jgi:hypothetical protein